MNGHSTEVKYWSPRLIELTAIANPQVAGDTPQAVFVDPTTISLIYRGLSNWCKSGSSEPVSSAVECTLVWLRGGGPSSISVIETPLEVAQRRDRALQVPVELGAVK